jgi:hypothetical protein
VKLENEYIVAYWDAWQDSAVRIYMDIPLNSYEEILINLKGPIHVFPNGL